MNDRIYTLATRAWMDNQGFNRDPIIPREFIDKFAELIVRECSNIVFEEGCTKDNQDCPNEELYQLSNKIERHFGIEL